MSQNPPARIPAPAQGSLPYGTHGCQWPLSTYNVVLPSRMRHGWEFGTMCTLTLTRTLTFTQLARTHGDDDLVLTMPVRAPPSLPISRDRAFYPPSTKYSLVDWLLVCCYFPPSFGAHIAVMLTQSAAVFFLVLVHPRACPLCLHYVRSTTYSCVEMSRLELHAFGGCVLCRLPPILACKDIRTMYRCSMYFLCSSGMHRPGLVHWLIKELHIYWTAFAQSRSMG